MDWKDVAGSIAKVAPLLGTVLGGPPGAAIGGVVALLANAFGLTKEETTPEKITALLTTDPTVAIKLAEIEANTKIELQKLVLQQAQIDLDTYRAELADTSSARQRETAIVQATGKKDYNLYTLSWVIVIGFYGLTGLLVFTPIPQGQNEVVFMLFGGIVSGFSTVLGYFFGSSLSSAVKSRLMAFKDKVSGN